MSKHRATVVVAIRDKQASALSFAVRAAGQLHRGLRVVHSTGVPMQSPGAVLGPELADELRADGLAVLEAARDRVEQQDPDLSVDYVLTTGATIDALEDEARRGSMLVVGVDELAWPDRLLGGAVAARLALRAPSPVVVVPERAYPTPLSGGVSVALDGDSLAEGPLRFAYEVADVTSRELHVMHALRFGTSRKEADEARANIAEVLAGWSSTYPDVRVSTQFPIGGANEACIQVTGRSELLVVGRPHHHSMAFAVARPLAAEVIRHAHCPVAVVPAEYRGPDEAIS